jgi:signal transduction histidine kinase
VAAVFLLLWRLDRRLYLRAFGFSFACVAVSLLASASGHWIGELAPMESLADFFYIASIALQFGGALALTDRKSAWVRVLGAAFAIFLAVQLASRFGIAGVSYVPMLSGAFYLGIATLFHSRHPRQGYRLFGFLYLVRGLVNMAWLPFYGAGLGWMVVVTDQVLVVVLALALIVCDLTAARRRAENAIAELSAQAQALKTLNVQLAEERSQADAANRAKSQFLANMSHELRTPLNAVIGFSDLIANSRIPNAAAQSAEYARLINSAGQHLLRIINDVLDMARIEAGKITVAAGQMNLRTAVDTVVSLVLLQAKTRSIGFSAHIADSAVHLEADEQLIKQVLANLLSNAFKYTPIGGAVRIEAEEAGPDQIRIIISDTGFGIAPRDLPHIFEPFEFTGSAMTRRAGGIGLGLSITKRLVELHGGTIAMTSTLGKGTTVTIVLPKRQRAPRGRPRREPEAVAAD